MPHHLVTRAEAAQATLDAWRDRPWRLGTADCVRLAADHLRRLGYKVKLPPVGAYRTVKSAVAALEKAGFASIPAALDAMGLERIVPAAALAGDVIEMAQDEDGGADPRLATLVIALGNGRVLGWHPDVRGATVLQPLSHMLTAWRAMPQTRRRRA